MKIGIIVAENEEMLAIKNIMKSIFEEKIYNLNFIKGMIHNHDVILVKCGVGKVNAARTTQILIDKYNPNYIINIGSAGSVTKELNIQDIVIGKELVQYDFDISSVGDYQKGEICGIGKYFYSDEMLVKLCKETIEEIKNQENCIKIGRIGTGDFFCASPEKAEEIRKKFEVECVEMEGAAIAQVCYLDKVPFLVIRGISDTPNGNNKVDFHTYLQVASKRATEVLEGLLLRL